MDKLLKRVNLDILYLNKLSFERVFSFGNKPKPVPAVDTGIIHNMCGVPVHIYYYTSKNTLVYTPGQVHTIYSKNYEGPHHPMCKIDMPAYSDYIINEGGIKWRGNTTIFSTEDLENNDPDKYTDEMLAALVLACFYSLHQRLHYYMKRIEDQQLTIDRGHNLAPIYTFDKLNSVIRLFRNEGLKRCVENLITTFKPITLDQLKILFEQIKYFSAEVENNPPAALARKNFIIEMYHTLMRGQPFDKDVIPFKDPEPLVKPRKLF
jgi:hypothetical protein